MTKKIKIRFLNYVKFLACSFFILFFFFSCAWKYKKNSDQTTASLNGTWTGIPHGIKPPSPGCASANSISQLWWELLMMWRNACHEFWYAQVGVSTDLGPHFIFRVGTRLAISQDAWASWWIPFTQAGRLGKLMDTCHSSSVVGVKLKECV